MSTGIDIKLVQESYQRMSDDELIRTATQEAHGLTTEAMAIVKAEVAKRGLDQNISDGLEAQNKRYTIEEVNSYCDLVSNLSCPICGSTHERLNATLTGEVMSFVVFTTYNKKIKIGCPACLDKESNIALLKTVLLGWWGIPWGIIRTPMAIALNLKSKKANHTTNQNDIFRAFTMSVVGELATYKDNKVRLQQILARQNAL